MTNKNLLPITNNLPRELKFEGENCLETRWSSSKKIFNPVAIGCLPKCLSPIQIEV